ncbi:phosphotransferase [Paenibacillus sp. sptzw28]|nr:phosphotransferase [Paenibacillus sp. sptzw28]
MLLSIIDENLYLMKDRPNLFQHDDSHIANFIVKDGKLSRIIDFNRHDWGDPIHEFVKVGIFSAAVSVPFSVGQVKPEELDTMLMKIHKVMDDHDCFKLIVPKWYSEFQLGKKAPHL